MLITMITTKSFIITITMTIIFLVVENMVASIQAQSPTTSDRLIDILNETDSNSTINVLNQSLPVDNATKAVPVVPLNKII